MDPLHIKNTDAGNIMQDYKHKQEVLERINLPTFPPCTTQIPQRPTRAYAVRGRRLNHGTDQINQIKLNKLSKMKLC
jgi:hypothetical protein